MLTSLCEYISICLLRAKSDNSISTALADPRQCARVISVSGILFYLLQNLNIHWAHR